MGQFTGCLAHHSKPSPKYQQQAYCRMQGHFLWTLSECLEKAGLDTRGKKSSSIFFPGLQRCKLYHAGLPDSGIEKAFQKFIIRRTKSKMLMACQKLFYYKSDIIYFGFPQSNKFQSRSSLTFQSSLWQKQTLSIYYKTAAENKS